ncbi:hypothetical protein LTR37_014516 [Vermiconidia calcicola]|uniref:Uncharacterized protein n=1 Tax=Vermiconidia calcicola TaxID=1690605 RepID=A0ACC3MTZ6_9PEZI|nr:hypothetical protein LTR37_014516 [Vermiconidia calcicola]
MDKLKKAFGSGHEEDNSVMYGTGSNVDSPSTTSQSTEPQKLATDPEAEKQSYGTPATSAQEQPRDLYTESKQTEPVQSDIAPAAALQTDPVQTEPEQKHHGLFSKIFSHKSKDEKPVEESSQSTTTQVPDRTRDTSSEAVLGTSISRREREGSDSGLSMKSGAYGPYAGSADSSQIGTTQSSTAPIGSSTDRTVPESSSGDNWGRDTIVAGAGAAGVAGGGAVAYDNMTREDEGIRRQDNADDVSQSTYTARSYTLPPGTASEPQGPSRTLDQSQADRPVTEDSDFVRDTSLTGAGTRIGAGPVGASELAAEENKPGDEDVANATYTDRAYPVGGVTATTWSQTEDGATQKGAVPYEMPHVPGEFPSSTGEDPHTPGGFPSGQTEDRGIGSTTTGPTVASELLADSDQPTEQRDLGYNSGTATGLGAGVAGATAAGAAGSYSLGPEQYSSRSVEQPTTATSTMNEPTSRSGESDFPIMTPTNSIPHATPATESDSHTGRNAAIAGGAAVGAGGLGYGAYEATRGDEPRESGITDRSMPETKTATTPAYQQDPAQGSNYSYPTRSVPETTSSAYQQEPTRGPDSYPTQSATETTPSAYQPEPTAEPESNTGRNTAIAGGSALGAGALGYGAYEATRDNDTTADRGMPETSRDWPMRDDSIPASTTSPTSQYSTQASEVPTSRDVPATTTSQYQEDPTAPTAEQSHTGRNAAIAGGSAAGAGALGDGAYQATRGDDYTADRPVEDRSMPQPITSEAGPGSATQPLPQSTSQVPQESYTEPPQSRSQVQQDPYTEPESHTGRNAAIAGGSDAGAGALGYGAYEATRGDDYARDRPMGDRSVPQTTTSETTQVPTTQDRSMSQTTKSEATQVPTTQSTLESKPQTQQDPYVEPESHTGRNTAIAGGTAVGAGALGYGAYEATQREDEAQRELAQEQQRDEEAKRLEKERERAEKEREHAEKEREKEREKAEKEHKKEQERAEKEKKKAEKEAEKEHEKEVKKKEKEEKEHQKELEKQKKHEQHEAEKRKKEEEKEAKRIEAARIEERKRREEEERLAAAEAEKKRREEESHYGRDAAIVGGGTAAAGAVGYGAYEATRDDTTAGPTSRANESELITTDPSTSDHPGTHSSLRDQHNPAVEGGAVAAGSEENKYTSTHDRDPSVEPTHASPEHVSASQATPAQPSYDDTDRNAALGGGAAAGAGAGAYGGYGASKEGYEAPTDNDEPRDIPMEKFRASHGDEQARERLEETHGNRVSADSQGHHHLHKKSAEQSGEAQPKKPSFMHRILHPNSSKKEKEEYEEAQRRHEEEERYRQSGEGMRDTTNMPGQQGYSRPPTDDDGMITITREGSAPDAPHAVVR